MDILKASKKLEEIKVDAYNSDGAATVDGNYRINDITVVYRTTRKEPSTAVNS